MSTIPARPNAAQSPNPRPSVCPTCGLAADNAVVTVAELTQVACYVCTNGHLWSVHWLVTV